MASKRKFEPTFSEINFAVADVHVLKDFKPYDHSQESTPGIFRDTINQMSKFPENKSACITFDGKKIKQGLTGDSGDVNLLGFEKGQSLFERKESLEIELQTIINLIDKAEDFDLTYKQSDTPDDFMCSSDVDIKEDILKQVANLAESMCQVEKIKVKKLYAKDRLIQNSGPDWRKGRYMYAISAITAFIHDIDSYISTARSISDKLCCVIAAMNGEKIIVGNKVNLEREDRYVSIVQVQDTSK
ncbi:hypothetical protein DPMN_188904 [Dreissena polymorpha]|uniref:Uncharacterized protein n=1 Tax=Dreissena polymorpha TaxID=45954 RepID=A0A9D4IAD0_DREPO|nr:hypothetical protein DPMN_188904 [Dreissena polymorpha]